MSNSSIGIQLITPDTGTAQQRPPPPPSDTVDASPSESPTRIAPPPEMGKLLDKLV